MTHAFIYDTMTYLSCNKTIMDFLKKLRQNKQFRVFVFTTINGAITVALTLLAMTQSTYLIAIAPPLMSILNGLTKYINVTVL